MAVQLCPTALQAASVTMTETFKLTLNGDPAPSFPNYATAISGNKAVIGTPKQGDTGAAYVIDLKTDERIELSAGYWTPRFGNMVAISENHSLAGTARNDESYFPEAYIFDNTTGEQIAKLAFSDNAIQRSIQSLAISDNHALVGLSGSGFYVYDLAAFAAPAPAPVPLPAAGWLLSVGIGALALTHRHRRS